MKVGGLLVSLRIEGCNNLKDKRKVLHSAIQRISNRFRCSVSEVGDQELWDSSELGISVTASESHTVREVLNAILTVMDSDPNVEVTDSMLRIFDMTDEETETGKN